MRHVFNLTEEELEIEAEFERGEYESVPCLIEERLRLKQTARNTIARKRGRFKF